MDRQTDRQTHAQALLNARLFSETQHVVIHTYTSTCTFIVQIIPRLNHRNRDISHFFGTTDSFCGECTRPHSASSGSLNDWGATLMWYADTD